MASITSLGAGSGLDLESIVTNLMAVEKQPVTLLQTKETKVLAKVSAYGQIKSTLSSFQDATTALATKATYSATSATSSSSAVISATSTSSAAAGSYSITVNALAQGQRVTSAAGSTPSVSAGSLTIQLGTYTTTNGTTSFAAASPAATALNFTGSSLTDLRDAINSAKTGVTASVVNDGNNSRLVLQSDGIGKSNGFQDHRQPMGSPASPLMPRPERLPASPACSPPRTPHWMFRALRSRDRRTRSPMQSTASR